MFTSRSRWCPPAVAALLLGATIACSGGDPTQPSRDPLSGLREVTRADSSETPQSPTGPGHFTGTVLGYQPGTDSLGTAVKLAGVRVTAYDQVESNGRVAAGNEVASVTTSSEGTFQLPSLAFGDYVVTFVPAAGSGYVGGWTTARAWSGSGDYPWTIMLPRED